MTASSYVGPGGGDDGAASVLDLKEGGAPDLRAVCSRRKVLPAVTDHVPSAKGGPQRLRRPPSGARATRKARAEKPPADASAAPALADSAAAGASDADIGAHTQPARFAHPACLEDSAVIEAQLDAPEVPEIQVQRSKESVLDWCAERPAPQDQPTFLTNVRVYEAPTSQFEFLQQLQHRIFEVEALTSYPTPFELHMHEHVSGLFQEVLLASFPDCVLEVVGPLSVNLSARNLPPLELLVRDHSALGPGALAVLNRVASLVDREPWVVAPPTIMHGAGGRSTLLFPVGLSGGYNPKADVLVCVNAHTGIEMASKAKRLFCALNLEYPKLFRPIFVFAQAQLRDAGLEGAFDMLTLSVIVGGFLTSFQAKIERESAVANRETVLAEAFLGLSDLLGDEQFVATHNFCCGDPMRYQPRGVYLRVSSSLLTPLSAADRAFHAVHVLNPFLQHEVNLAWAISPLIRKRICAAFRSVWV